MMARVGLHTNVVEFLGASDERGIYFHITSIYDFIEFIYV